MKRWTTAKLRQGDLTALARIADRQSFNLEQSQIKRLSERGFLRRKRDNDLAVTLRGRVALLIRRFIQT